MGKKKKEKMRFGKTKRENMPFRFPFATKHNIKFEQ